MRKKRDSNDFSMYGYWFQGWAGLSISKTADRLRFTENGPEKKKKRKYPVSSSSLGKNALLMPEVRGYWSDYFELTGRQQQLKQPLTRTKVFRSIYLNAQTLRLEVCIIPQQKTTCRAKMLPNLMSFDFFCEIHMVASEFGVRKIKT